MTICDYILVFVINIVIFLLYCDFRDYIVIFLLYCDLCDYIVICWNVGLYLVVGLYFSIFGLYYDMCDYIVIFFTKSKF